MELMVIIGLIGVLFVLPLLMVIGLRSSSRSDSTFIPAQTLDPSLARRVARLEQQVAYLTQQLGLAGGDFPANSTPEIPNELREYLLKDQKILAIKLYRELYNVGLKEAKDAVDAIETELGI